MLSVFAVTAVNAAPDYRSHDKDRSPAKHEKHEKHEKHDIRRDFKKQVHQPRLPAHANIKAHQNAAIAKHPHKNSNSFRHK